MFEIGEAVVAIEDLDDTVCFDNWIKISVLPIKKSEIKIIRGIEFSSFSAEGDEPGLVFHGIMNPIHSLSGQEFSYHSKYFRKLTKAEDEARLKEKYPMSIEQSLAELTEILLSPFPKGSHI